MKPQPPGQPPRKRPGGVRSAARRDHGGHSRKPSQSLVTSTPTHWNLAARYVSTQTP